MKRQFAPNIVVFVFLALASCGPEDNANGRTPDAGPFDDAGLAPDAGNDNGTTTDGGAEPDSGGGDAGSSSQGAIGTTSGPVTGTSQGSLKVYRGIPYAAPPVGELRFRPPNPHEGWDEPLAATVFGPVCPQRDSMAGDTGDEDCLTLNIWTPEDASGLPVMVWIHGGAFVTGAGSLPIYDGSDLASAGVVVVSINYRLGALGFLALEELADESGEDSAGNYGLRDQQLALQWVQDNIAGFGGNPSNVTIFGESAGGVSVCAHLGSPLSEGLFVRGIIESGAGCYGWPPLRDGTVLETPAVETGELLVSAAGCDDAADRLQCLRDADALALVDAQYNLGGNLLGLPPFGPNIDGVVLTDQTLNLYESGQVSDRPVITGSNADEATVFTSSTPVPTVDAYERLVRGALGNVLGDQVLEAYPASDFDTPKDAWNALVGDITFICSAKRFAEVAAGGSEPAYHYHFTKTLEGAGASLGSFHGLEIVYVFGTYDTFPAYIPTEDDDSMSAAMIEAWTSFASNGIPLTDPAWPQATATNTPTLVFDVPLATANEIREGRCADLMEIGLIP